MGRLGRPMRQARDKEARMTDTMHWVGTWTAAPAPGEGAAFSNHTLRMIPRVSLGGRVLRVRISNAYGARPLAIGAAYVGLRSTGPVVVPGSNRRLTFGRESSATIAAGALIVSDPVELAVEPLADVAVSVHLPGDLPASFGITGRYARQTNYVSPPADFAEEEVTAPQMIAGLKQFAVRGQARGIKVVGGTLTPFENETFLPGAWNPRREAVRQAVNDWLRKAEGFDAVVDFDRALRDPGHPTQMLPIYDCGDHLHPSDLGYRTMGDAIDLGLFE